MNKVIFLLQAIMPAVDIISSTNQNSEKAKQPPKVQNDGCFSNS